MLGLRLDHTPKRDRGAWQPPKRASAPAQEATGALLVRTKVRALAS
jgi:hypothetical protein